MGRPGERAGGEVTGSWVSKHRGDQGGVEGPRRGRGSKAQRTHRGSLEGLEEEGDGAHRGFSCSKSQDPSAEQWVGWGHEERAQSLKQTLQE